MKFQCDIKRFARSMVLAIAASAVASVLAPAQSVAAGESTVTFPNNPANWMNSGCISAEMLSGKAALLYFFEEG
jgi:hypothetical protein